MKNIVDKWMSNTASQLKSFGVEEVYIRRLSPPELFLIVTDRQTIEKEFENWKVQREILKEIGCDDVSVGTRSSFNFCGGKKWDWELLNKNEQHFIKNVLAFFAGSDGIVFENCKFDNEMIEIDTDSSVTFLGMEEQKEEKNKVRIQELLQKRKQRENKL